MRNLWLDLVSCARWCGQASGKGSAAKGASVDGAVQQRLRILQLFRHEAAHLVAALQAYMQGQLLGACWHQLQRAITVSCTRGRAQLYGSVVPRHTMVLLVCEPFLAVNC